MDPVFTTELIVPSLIIHKYEAALRPKILNQRHSGGDRPFPFPFSPFGQFQGTL